MYEVTMLVVLLQLPGKTAVPVVNGGNAASSNGDHKGQGDSPLND